MDDSTRLGRPKTLFVNSCSTYEDIHYILVRNKGAAKTHVCACTAQAFEWAYQHTGNILVDERGREFSRNLEDYAPMCRSCHRLLDEKHHPGSLGERGKKGLRTRASQGYSEQHRKAARANLEKARAVAAVDPQQREKASRAGRLGGLARAEKMRRG